MKRYDVLILFVLVSLLVGCSRDAISEKGHEHEGFVSVTNGKIFFRSLGGDRLPIVVVHGGPGLDQTYLQPQMYDLLQNRQLIFYDQRGSGRSLETVINSETINLNRFVEDLEQLRQALHLKQFILMGHSWGGLLAMQYAITHPANLRGLILLNTAPADYQGQKSFVDEFSKRAQKIQDEIQPLFSYQAFEKQNVQEISDLYRKLFSVYFYDSKKVQDLSLNFNLSAARSGFKVNVEMSKTSWLHPETNLLPQLKNLNIPTLIIHGKQDIVPVWTVKQINRAINNSKMVILDQCGHFAYIEQKNKFSHAINDFVGSFNHECCVD